MNERCLSKRCAKLFQTANEYFISSVQRAIWPQIVSWSQGWVEWNVQTWFIKCAAHLSIPRVCVRNDFDNQKRLVLASHLDFRYHWRKTKRMDWQRGKNAKRFDQWASIDVDNNKRKKKDSLAQTHRQVRFDCQWLLCSISFCGTISNLAISRSLRFISLLISRQSSVQTTSYVRYLRPFFYY